MESILVATDFSPRADRALRRAVLLARQFSSGITLLHALDDELPEQLLAVQRDACETLLAEMAATIANGDQVECSYRLMVGDPIRTLSSATRSLGADLIVVGAHRRSLLKDTFVGTTVERTIRGSAAPVLMANAVPARGYQRVLVATDLSECSLEATKTARALGLLDGMHLTVLHVFESPETGMMRRSLMPADEIEDHRMTVRADASADLQSFISSTGVRPDRKSVQPVEMSVADTILGAVRKARSDLLVMGTHGRSGVGRFFLGSVSEQVLKNTEIDVLVVPLASADDR